jgi:hypothetical protein
MKEKRSPLKMQEISFSKSAVYDAVNFDMYEKRSTDGNAVSNTIVLQNPYLPVHDYYT